MTSTSTGPDGRPPTRIRSPHDHHLTTGSAGADIVAALAAGFASVSAAGPPVQESIRLADRTVALQMGPAIARRFQGAFSRAGGTSGPPDAPAAQQGEGPVIRAWDSARSEVPPPPSPWGKGDFLPRDGLRGSGGDGYDYAYDVTWRLLSVWDRARQEGWFWAADAGRFPYWEPTSPFRYLIHWALADQGAVLAHAAAVGTGGSGLLIVGRGGAGKSTSALACLAAGWDYISDDYCVLTSGGTPTAHPLYSAAKLGDGSKALLPDLYRHARPGPPSSPKRLIHPEEFAPERCVATLPVTAVVVPEVGEATGEPRRISAAVAARALSASTTFQMAGTRPETLSLIRQVIDGLPAYGLVVGPDVALIPERLAACLP